MPATDDNQKCVDLEIFLAGEVRERLRPFSARIVKVLQNPTGLNARAWLSIDEQHRQAFFRLVIAYFSADSNKMISDFATNKQADISQMIPKTDIRQLSLMVLEVLSLWTMLEGIPHYYTATPTTKRIRLSETQKLNGEFSPKDLVDLPQHGAPAAYSSSSGQNIFKEVPARLLNAELLTRVGKIEIAWTFDVGAHLQLDEGSTPPILSVFQMPGRFDFRPPDDSVEAKLRFVWPPTKRGRFA